MGWSEGETSYYADDLIFAAIDLGGGFKSPEQVGLELAKTAATAALSAGCSAAGSAVSSSISAAMDGIGKGWDFLAQSAISMTQSYVTTVGNSAINSLYINADGKLDFNKDGFVDSLHSAGTISSMVGAGITGGLNGVYATDSNGIALNGRTFNANGIHAMTGLAGGLATNAVSLAMGGDATFNLASAYGVGFLEFSIGKNGVQSRFGMGGTNISYQNLKSAYGGISEAKKVAEWKYDSGEENKRTLNAINMLGYTKIETNQQLASEIWNGTKNVEYQNLNGEYGHFNASEDSNKVILSDALLGKGKEASAILSTVMSHEGTHVYGNRVEGLAHLTGLQTYSQLEDMFNLKENKVFTESMEKALYDKNSWRENTGDTDYWLLKTDGTIVWDGSKDLNVEYYDEWGNLHTSDKTEEGYNKAYKPKTMVKASADATYAGTLAEYVGEERASQILASKMKNINDAGSYSKVALMDILNVSEEVATQIQHTGRLPYNTTDEQKQRLIGEALMASGGMTWNGEKRGNKDNFSISMSDYDIGQIVIKKNADGSYDRFGITAEVYRDEKSFSSTRNETSNGASFNGNQGLDYIYLYKKDLNGKTISSTLGMEFSKGWQTVANGYKDPDMDEKAYPDFNIKDGYSDNIYRGSTVTENQDFYMRFGNFNNHSKFDGYYFIINRANTLQEGLSNKSGYTSVSSDRILGHSNFLLWTKSKPYPHEDSGGFISASCFMNTKERTNAMNNWVMSNVPYSYDVKTIVRPKYGPMWK